MSLVETKVEIKAVKGSKKTDIYDCTWDGDFGEWMMLGGEVGGVVEYYDEVTMTLRRIVPDRLPTSEEKHSLKCPACGYEVKEVKTVPHSDGREYGTMDVYKCLSESCGQIFYL